MKYYYDLHMHSVLSPDACDLMTPHNILNMSMIKGLDIIAVTDHNSLKQLSVIKVLSEGYDFLCIPGVELNVKEGFHLLVYFKSFEEAFKFDEVLSNYIEHQSTYTKDDQMLTDIYDEVIDYLKDDLARPLTLNLSDLYVLLENYEHLKVAAHIERPHTSMIEHIRKYPVDALEITHYAKNRPAVTTYVSQNTYKILYNSDAHDLLSINERTEHNQIEMDHLSIEAFFKAIKHG